jgi:hypothetical protein
VCTISLSDQLERRRVVANKTIRTPHGVGSVSMAFMAATIKRSAGLRTHQRNPVQTARTGEIDIAAPSS